ncbi:NAD(+) synthetase [Sulfolobales archaeon HS-7]|nr:NAD(+) synthetase [Sulfolobales archaeon HS-7]
MYLPEIDYNKVTETIVSQLQNYIERYGAKGGVIGLSGGVDSSVTAYLLRKATDNIFALVMPSSSTPPNDVKDAIDVIKLLNIKDYKIINIDEIVDIFSKNIINRDNRVIGNVKARVRMTLLYAYAQTLDYLVIGTGDKSEILLGYFTKYGDGGVDVLPIGELYKTWVRKLAKAIGIPENIYTKPSSPALWTGQTAEGELGISYEKADDILFLLVEKRMGIEEIHKLTGYPIPTIERVYQLYVGSEHKRNMPPIMKISL